MMETRELTDGLYFGLSDDGCARIYRLEKISVNAIQLWSQHVYNTLANWDTAVPYLVLHDLSAHGVVLNFSTIQKELLNIGVMDSNLKRIQPFINAETGFVARVGVLVSLHTSGHIARMLSDIQAQRQGRDEHIRYRVFAEREDALAWLCSADV